MNIQQLRESLKIKWVRYYHQNRSWLAKMRIWGTYDGYRRPSSGFILATFSVLEPKLDEIFPFILELNNNPDQIIAALGLNFNPEEQLYLIKDLDEPANDCQIDDRTVINKVIFDTFNAEKIDDREINEPPPEVLTAITEIESFSHPQKITSTSASVETEWKNFSEESMVAQLESEEEVLSLLTMCNQAEEGGKMVKVSPETEPEQVKPRSSKKNSNLASWIDEFCQGVDWDREEAIFIPF
ncbi:MAG: DUF5331 domain-containing protein [Rivularia sp. (in: cyanobacteria)]